MSQLSQDFKVVVWTLIALVGFVVGAHLVAAIFGL